MGISVPMIVVVSRPFGRTIWVYHTHIAFCGRSGAFSGMQAL